MLQQICKISQYWIWYIVDKKSWQKYHEFLSTIQHIEYEKSKLNLALFYDTLMHFSTCINVSLLVHWRQNYLPICKVEFTLCNYLTCLIAPGIKNNLSPEYTNMLSLAGVFKENASNGSYMWFLRPPHMIWSILHHLV